MDRRQLLTGAALLFGGCTTPQLTATAGQAIGPPAPNSGPAVLLRWFAQNLSDPRLHTYKGFDETTTHTYEAMVRISMRVTNPDLDYIPEQTEVEWSRKILRAANEVIEKLAPEPNANLRTYLQAQAIIDWVRTHILFDVDLEHAMNSQPSPLSREDVRRRFEDGVVLSMKPQPATVCGGMAWICSVLGKIGGLEMNKVEGHLRDGPNYRDPAASASHAWVNIRLPDGTIRFADPSNARLRLPLARRRAGRIINPYVLPFEAEAMGYFMATHWTMNGLDWVEDKKRIGGLSAKLSKFSTDPHTRMSFGTWAEAPFDRLRPLRETVDRDMRDAFIGGR